MRSASLIRTLRRRCLSTFEVKPPASFGSDEFPEQGAFEFKIAGTAGQALHVKLDHGWYEYALVEPLGDSKRLMIPGGDELGNRLYVLPKTATYRVVVQRTEIEDRYPRVPAIEFALLDISDPLETQESGQNKFLLISVSLLHKANGIWSHIRILRATRAISGRRTLRCRTGSLSFALCQLTDSGAWCRPQILTISNLRSEQMAQEVIPGNFHTQAMVMRR